ncbi:MAG: hypothetical protein ACYCW5_05205, partial [Thermoleophilia bacterium]
WVTVTSAVTAVSPPPQPETARIAAAKTATPTAKLFGSGGNFFIFWIFPRQAGIHFTKAARRD